MTEDKTYDAEVVGNEDELLHDFNIRIRQSPSTVGLSVIRARRFTSVEPDSVFEELFVGFEDGIQERRHLRALKYFSNLASSSSL